LELVTQIRTHLLRAVTTDKRNDKMTEICLDWKVIKNNIII